MNSLFSFTMQFEKLHIAFYQPKSFGASFFGVITQIFLFLLPSGIIFMFLSGQESTNWLWLIPGFAAGIFLYLKSDFIIYPLFGDLHEFFFEGDLLTIVHKGGKTTWNIPQELKLSSFEAAMEGGSVHHLVITTPDGIKYDIFDTWVTAKTMENFGRACKVIKSTRAGLNLQ